jgi:hypothetical protein
MRRASSSREIPGEEVRVGAAHCVPSQSHPMTPATTFIFRERQGKLTSLYPPDRHGKAQNFSPSLTHGATERGAAVRLHRAGPGR